MPVFLFTSRSLGLSISRSVRLSVCPSPRLSVYITICLSDPPSKWITVRPEPSSWRQRALQKQSALAFIIKTIMTNSDGHCARWATTGKNESAFLYQRASEGESDKGQKTELKKHDDIIMWRYHSLLCIGVLHQVHCMRNVILERRKQKSRAWQWLQYK